MSIKKVQEDWESFLLFEELESKNIAENLNDQWQAKAKEYYGAVGAQKMAMVVSSTGEQRLEAVRDLMNSQKQFLKQWIKSVKQNPGPSGESGTDTKELIQKLEKETEENKQIAQKAEQAVQQAKSNDVIEKIKQKEEEHYKKQAEQMGKMMEMHFQTLKMSGASDKQIYDAARDAMNRLDSNQPWSQEMAYAIVNARKKVAPSR